jgi:N-acetylglucosamine-6-phosphate deacetylase
MISTIKARRLLSAGGIVEYPQVTIDDDRVQSIESLTPADYERAPATHHFPGATLAPSYIDIHIHGCAGHDVMEATPDALDAIGVFLAGRGVGAYFPTTVTSSRDKTLRSLQGLATEIERLQRVEPRGATPLGIHLEGPFLSHLRRGAHIESLLEAPSV